MRIAARASRALSASQRVRVRRSCQTIARATGSPAAAVPEQRGLALVGDADRRDAIAARPARAAQRARHRGAARSPRSRPASCSTQPGLREVLRQLGVAAAAHRAGAIEQQRGRTGRALVDGENECVAATCSRLPRRRRRCPPISARAAGVRDQRALFVHARFVAFDLVAFALGAPAEPRAPCAAPRRARAAEPAVVGEPARGCGGAARPRACARTRARRARAPSARRRRRVGERRRQRRVESRDRGRVAARAAPPPRASASRAMTPERRVLAARDASRAAAR